MNAAARPPPAARTRSLAANLIGFAAALALPTLLLCGLLLWQFAAGERARYERESLNVARGLAVALDRELIGLQSTLQALATSPALRGGDLKAFHEQASEVGRTLGLGIVLRDLTRQQLVNTRVPFGQPLPRGAEIDVERRVVETRRSGVTNVVVGAVAQRPLVGAIAPVLGEGGAVSGVLLVNVEAERLRDAMLREGVPEGWVAAAIDRNDVIVARTLRHEENAGRSSLVAYSSGAFGEAGSRIGPNREGLPSLVAYARSEASGWYATVAVPLALLEAPLRGSLVTLAGLAALLAAAATWLALLFARRIAAPVRALAAAAAALGRGEAVQPLATPIREVDEVGRALSHASHELHRQGAALRESEERLRLIVESATDTSIVTSDTEGTITSWSPGAEAIFGWSAAEAVGRPTALIFTPEDRAGGEDRKELEAARRDGYAADERWHLRRDGGRVFMSGSARPLHDAKGRQVGFVKVARDETERRRVAEALATSERRLRALFDTVPVGIVIAEAPSGRIIEGNARTEAIFRHPILPSPDMEGYCAWAARHPDGRPLEPEEYPLSRAIRGEEERPEGEYLYGRGDGTDAWVRLIGAPIRDEAGLVVAGVVAILDIDREKRAEEALRALNATLEERVAERTRERDRIWRVSQDLLLVARFDGAIEAANPAWGAVLGWSEDDLVGRSFLELVHPDDRESTLEEAGRLSAGQATPRFENRYRRRDGAYVWLSWTAAPEEGFLYAVARDVTAEKEAAAALAKAEEQLRQAQKMEAVGRLTGGVAHDFNNMLQVMVGRLDRMRRLAAKGGVPTERDLQSMDYALERATSLTHRLLAFSRQQPLELRSVEVNKLVSGMSDLLGQTLGESVHIETVLSGGLWKTAVDPNQLENAILNLAVNARDAMPGGGKLTIETANVHLDEAYAQAQGGEVPAGRYVMIAVSDTGTGMPPEVAAKAFDPFFTTKPQGQGTGLGLSMIYGFVKQSGGHVRIYTEAGRGTTIRVYLPREVEGAGEGAPVPDEADRPAVPRGRGEAVLIVEDEEEVRRLKGDTLRELGYEVVEAGEAREGLRLLGERGDVVLLLTDIGLPGGMNGRALAEEARARRPGLRVLFTTGYAPNAVLHRDGAEAGVELLSKPFTQEALATKVRRLLDAAPAPVPAVALPGEAAPAP